MELISSGHLKCGTLRCTFADDYFSTAATASNSKLSVLESPLTYKFGTQKVQSNDVDQQQPDRVEQAVAGRAFPNEDHGVDALVFHSLFHFLSICFAVQLLKDVALKLMQIEYDRRCAVVAAAHHSVAEQQFVWQAIAFRIVGPND